MKTLGQIGYEAYCNHTGWKSLATGDNLPQWDALRPAIREAWEAAGNAVAFRDGLKLQEGVTPLGVKLSPVA